MNQRSDDGNKKIMPLTHFSNRSYRPFNVGMKQKQHNRQLPDDLGFISAESKTEKTAGSLDMVSRAKKTPDPGKAAKRSGRKNLISVDAIHKDNIAPAKEKTIAKAKRDAGGIDKLPGVADKKKSEKSNRERERALKGHGDLTIAAGVQSTAGFTEGKNKRGSSAAGSCKTTERKKKSSIHERRQAHEEFDDETASAATTPTESDESKLLEKLLDENAPSPEFEDDHHKLLQKFLRVRDGENVRPQHHLYWGSRCELDTIDFTIFSIRCLTSSKGNETVYFQAFFSVVSQCSIYHRRRWRLDSLIVNDQNRFQCTRVLIVWIYFG